MLGSLYTARLLCRFRIPNRPFSFTARRYAEVQSTLHTPSFQQEVARFAGAKFFSDKLKYPSVSQQVFFFVSASFIVYVIASRKTNVETYVWTAHMQETGLAWKYRLPTFEEMKRARYIQFGTSLQRGLSNLREAVEGWPETLKNVVTWTYVQVFQPVLDTSDGHRICWSIGAVNTLVWLAWQMPRLQPFMTRHFVHNPMSGLSYTLFTSIFSHRNLFHLVLNNIVLAGFGTSAAYALHTRHQGEETYLRESSARWHFLAFLITSGMFSNLVPHVVAMRFTYPRLVARFSAARSASLTSASASSVNSASTAAASASPTIAQSLGSSGAIYASLALIALEFPDTIIDIAMSYNIGIPVVWTAGTLVAVDIVGVLRGWRRFNHWAHLGGVAFGALYHLCGHNMWEAWRRLTLENLPPSLANPMPWSDQSTSTAQNTEKRAESKKQ